MRSAVWFFGNFLALVRTWQIVAGSAEGQKVFEQGWAPWVFYF